MSVEIPEPLTSLKNFLSIRDLDPESLQELVDYSIMSKGRFKRGELEPVLQGKVLAMIFQKPSLRTRLGFEAAMAQLGGHAINLEERHIGISSREEPKDVARVISSMCDGIMARVTSHQLVIELADQSRVPVINGLSDWSHPCQALCDLMTIQEHFGELAGRKLAFIGDGNNVARSLLSGCAKLGVHFAIASPEGYGLGTAEIQSTMASAQRTGATISEVTEPAEAVVGADVIYTDVWTSMGAEDEREEREKLFARYQINESLVAQAKPTAVVMHCLPACRNQEITDEVMDGRQSIIFQQAENRLHSQRALLMLLLGRGH